MNRTILLAAVIAGLASGGCRASTVVLGNLTTMCIVLVMFWSTLRLNHD